MVVATPLTDLDGEHAVLLAGSTRLLDKEVLLLLPLLLPGQCCATQHCQQQQPGGRQEAGKCEVGRHVEDGDGLRVVR